MKKRFYNFIPLAAAVFALFLLCGCNRAATMPPDDTAAAGPETVAAMTAAGPETRAESENPAGSAIAAAPVQTGLAVENGSVVFRNEDGSLFTGGLKAVTENGDTKLYYFQEDGTAFTGGYRPVRSSAGTDYYYFLSNGQAFNTGYKSVRIGGAEKIFFFQEDGKAFTGGLKRVDFGGESYLYYFQATGQALTGAFKTVDGVEYCWQADGRAARNAFVTSGGDLRYYGDDCAPTAGGWFCVGDGYYYADESGRLLTDTVREGYRLDENGKSATKYRIALLAAEHTDETMTDQEKIDALYDWILGSRMTYIHAYEHLRSSWVWEEGWPDDMASSLLDQGGGNCYRYASLFAFLVREATGLPVTLWHGMTPGIRIDRTPHGWVTVRQDGKWYSYDVELQKFSGYPRESCWKVPYSESSGTLYFDGIATNLYGRDG